MTHTDNVLAKAAPVGIWGPSTRRAQAGPGAPLLRGRRWAARSAGQGASQASQTGSECLEGSLCFLKVCLEGSCLEGGEGQTGSDRVIGTLPSVIVIRVAPDRVRQGHRNPSVASE